MLTLEPEDLLRHSCDGSLGRWVTLRHTRHGAQSHCIQCKLVLACLDWAAPGHFDLEDVLTISVHYNGGINIDLRNNENGWSNFYLECSRLDTRSRTISAFGDSEFRHILPSKTSSRSTFKDIEYWLHDCLSCHLECNVSGDKQRMQILQGIRFLKLTEDTAILVEDVVPTRYACLSHCWGSGHDIPRTTTSNLRAHKREGIELTTLPKTFRDAVRICRNLGVDFLWIDSLCIIRDNLADWRNQAIRMADIYENSFITIAAGKASSPGEGCFAKVHHSYRGEALPGFNNVHIRRTTLDPPTAYFWRDGLLLHEENHWPLFRRGWIYQELCLSPRIVLFGPQQVIWHCRTRSKSQGSAAPVSRLDMYRPPVQMAEKGSLLSSWHYTVRAYSSRNLTFLQDCLPAIAAIAMRYQDLRPGDQYLAGLWKNTLLFDLLWERFDDTDTTFGLDSSHREPFLGAPTWSWVRRAGNVKWVLYYDEKQLGNVEVLEIVYEVDGPTFSGRIKTAAITMRAPLLQLARLVSRHALEDDWDPYTKEGMANVISSAHDVSQTGPFFEPVLVHTSWDFSIRSVTDDIFVLPLVIGSSWNEPALLVRKTRNKQEYERLGIVYMHLRGTKVITEMIILWSGVKETLEPARLLYQKHLFDQLESLETTVVCLV